jgi:hypothetical protein
MIISGSAEVKVNNDESAVERRRLETEIQTVL